MKEIEVISVKEAAAFLKCTPKTIYRLLKRGKLTSIGCIRHKKIPAASLLALIEGEGV